MVVGLTVGVNVVDVACVVVEGAWATGLLVIKMAGGGLLLGELLIELVKEWPELLLVFLSLDLHDYPLFLDLLERLNHRLALPKLVLAADGGQLLVSSFVFGIIC